MDFTNDNRPGQKPLIERLRELRAIRMPLVKKLHDPEWRRNVSPETIAERERLIDNSIEYELILMTGTPEEIINYITSDRRENLSPDEMMTASDLINLHSGSNKPVS